MSLITHKYKCEICGRTEARIVHRKEVDQQHCTGFWHLLLSILKGRDSETLMTRCLSMPHVTKYNKVTDIRSRLK